MSRFGGFSPDGDAAVFTRVAQGGIYVHDLGVGKTALICEMDGNGGLTTFSPCGGWIAFQYNETSARRNRGRWDVYVVPATGGEPVCLTADRPSHSVAPAWRPTPTVQTD